VDDGLAVPFDGGYRAWRAAVADGWTVLAAAAAEAARLRPTGQAGRREGRAVARPAAPTALTTPSAVTALTPGASALTAPTPAAPVATVVRPRRRVEKLSKDAYRRQKSTVDAELTRLGLRKNHLELAMADPAVQANFVELRRITSELADVEAALGAAEDAWLEIEERAP
jgi:hypothetical protein